MTRRKQNPIEDALRAGAERTSLVQQIEGQLLLVADDLTAALDFFPDDQELSAYVAASAAPLVFARLTELHMLGRVQLQEDVRLHATSKARAATTSARNKLDSEQEREADLKKLDRGLADGSRTLAEALQLAWPRDKAKRDRVRVWFHAREQQREEQRLIADS